MDGYKQMNRGDGNSYSARNKKRNGRDNPFIEDIWRGLAQLKPEYLDSIFTITDVEWISMFVEVCDHYFRNPRRVFRLSRDPHLQYSMRDNVEDTIDSLLFSHIRIQDLVYEGTKYRSVHVDPSILRQLKEFRQLLRQVTNDQFMRSFQFRLLSESSQNTFFYKLFPDNYMTIDALIAVKVEACIWKYAQSPMYPQYSPEISSFSQSLEAIRFFWSTQNSFVHSKIIRDFITYFSIQPPQQEALFESLTDTFKINSLCRLPARQYVNAVVRQLLQACFYYIVHFWMKSTQLMNLENTTRFIATHSTQPLVTPLGHTLDVYLNRGLMSVLGNDLLLFSEWCSYMNNNRKDSRLAVISEISKVVHRELKGCSIEVYGSFRSGLSLPSSDVDLVVTHSPTQSLGQSSTHSPNALPVILNDLEKVSWISSVKHIKGGTPVLKVYVDPLVSQNICVTHAQSPSAAHSANQSLSEQVNDVIICDITQGSESHNGVKTALYMKAATDRFFELPPLILFMKQILYERQLNSAYDGGLNSVAIISIVICYFNRLMSLPVQYDTTFSNMPYDEKVARLGYLTARFLHFLAFVFNQSELGVCSDGFFMRNDLSLSMNQSKLFSMDPMVVIDPFNQLNNLGKSCFQIEFVLDHLRTMYRRLIMAIDAGDKHPFLSLLAVNEEVLSFQNTFERMNE